MSCDNLTGTFRGALVSFDDSPGFQPPWEDFEADFIVVDPYEVHAPCRRSDQELDRVLEILDNLENGKGTTR